MKSRLTLSLLMTMFLSGTALAQNPIERRVVLKGEFAQAIGSLEVSVPPVSASLSKDAVSIDFKASVGDVDIVVKDAAQNVRSFSTESITDGQKVVIPVNSYQPGTYVIELTDTDGGYVSGEFTLM